jgi:predicted small secreted protein
MRDMYVTRFVPLLLVLLAVALLLTACGKGGGGY